MRCTLSRCGTVLAVFLTVASCVRAQAQSYPQPEYPQQTDPQEQQYPPESEDVAEQQTEDLQRGVARISVVQGDVNIKRGDSGEVVAAAMNAPLVAQDRLQTGAGSKAEVEFDYGNLVRLAPATDLGMAALQYHRYQLQLAAGTISYRVLRNSEAQVEIDTPSIAAKPMRQGEYRVSVFEDGTTRITVRSGELEIYSPRGSQRISAGHTVLVRGNPADPEFQPTYELAKDRFDGWCEDRDRQLLASRSYQYVSPDIGGADELDQYGTWVPSQYGTVWAPRPPTPDWAPYSYGHWVWEDYYGWSWVDYAPWGWAPYHYGRWFWNGGYGWCWWAGPTYGRHLWRPALVGFFGFGGVGVTVGAAGFGGLGWVPLAPFETIHPWWGRRFHGGYYGRGGYENLTIIRNANITNIYRNSRIHGGAITGSYNAFGRGGQRFGRANFNELRNVSLVRGQIPAVPTRASLQYGNGRGYANPRFAAAERRNFFQHQTAPEVPHPSFSQQQTRVQDASRRAFENRQTAGWQRFGSPGTANGFAQGTLGGAATDRGGWHSFGTPPQHSGRTVGRPNQPAVSFGGGRSFGYRNPDFQYRAPAGRYNAPQSSAPRYNTRQYSAPRYNAPQYRAPAENFRGNSGYQHRGGNMSQHGGGSHQSGHRGR